MSVVTDMILLTAIADGGHEDEHPNADRLSAYLERHHNRTLEKVDQHAGGNKCMQCDVFLSAINFIDKDAFVSWFRSIEWETPESVQLLLKGEHDDAFTTYTPSEETNNAKT